MPPRHAYWTILVDDLPTAFRAAEREDLLPTFERLRKKHRVRDAVVRARPPVGLARRGDGTGARARGARRELAPGGPPRGSARAIQEAARHARAPRARRASEGRRGACRARSRCDARVRREDPGRGTAARRSVCAGRTPARGSPTTRSPRGRGTVLRQAGTARVSIGHAVTGLPAFRRAARGQTPERSRAPGSIGRQGGRPVAPIVRTESRASLRSPRGDRPQSDRAAALRSAAGGSSPPRRSSARSPPSLRSPRGQTPGRSRAPVRSAARRRWTRGSRRPPARGQTQSDRAPGSIGRPAAVDARIAAPARAGTDPRAIARPGSTGRPAAVDARIAAPVRVGIGRLGTGHRGSIAPVGTDPRVIARPLRSAAGGSPPRRSSARSPPSLRSPAWGQTPE